MANRQNNGVSLKDAVGIFGGGCTGEIRTESRTTFHEKSIAWYYGEILRDCRKQLKITQQELAEKVGTARSYIARVEKGETDIQISSFFRIARAIGIEFTPTFL